MSMLDKIVSLVKKLVPQTKKDEWDLTTALDLYREFVDKGYSSSKDHALPAEFIARCVKQDAIWLVELLVGVAFYAIKFDDSTKSYFSPELLKKAGYTDPCVDKGLVKRVWVQTTSTGKTHTDPRYESEISGLSIANYDASGLIDFYTGKILTASLPRLNENNTLVSVTEKKEVTYKGKQIKGWGLSYGNSKLTLDNVCWNPKIGWIDDSCNLCCKDTDDLKFKCVGASDSSKNLPSDDRKIWYAWSRYYLTGEGSKIVNNTIFPAAKWFCSYWAPYYSWQKDGKLQDTDQIMMLAAIANSTPSLAKKLFGKPVQQMIESYATNSHRKRRVYNTMRAISIVKYLKSVKY